jgi:hypothetical protein
VILDGPFEFRLTPSPMPDAQARFLVSFYEKVLMEKRSKEIEKMMTSSSPSSSSSSSALLVGAVVLTAAVVVAVVLFKRNPNVIVPKK